jgi:hypothetical protein
MHVAYKTLINLLRLLLVSNPRTPYWFLVLSLHFASPTVSILSSFESPWAAVATGNSGSSRCNRFKRKSSVVDATQPSSRVLQPSNNASTAALKANGEAITETKDKAARLKEKAIGEKKEEGINNKAEQAVKDNK